MSSNETRRHHESGPTSPLIDAAQWRVAAKELQLGRALRKRAAGVPTYTVPEAAALLSVSQEHLYRLIRADAFPAINLKLGREQGRYIVPARAIEELLDLATTSGALVDAADIPQQNV